MIELANFLFFFFFQNLPLPLLLPIYYGLFTRAARMIDSDNGGMRVWIPQVRDFCM